MRRTSLLLGLVLGGCAPPYDLALSWVFVDGRDCADAGVESVSLRIDDHDASGLFRCTSGQGGRTVTLTQAAPGQDVEAAALSPGGGALYRAAAKVPDAPGPLELTFYFTGGQ